MNKIPEYKAKMAPLQRINLDESKLQKGLAKLVLTIIELLRQILEKQAQRRISEGTLTHEEVERLGLAFMHIKEAIDKVSKEFGFETRELDTTLGSLLRSNDSCLNNLSVVDIVDKLLAKGTVIAGKVNVSVAEIDLITVDLLASISTISPSKRKVGVQRNG